MQILKWVPLLMGTVAVAVGMGAVFFPDKSSAGFGLCAHDRNQGCVHWTGFSLSLWNSKFISALLRKPCHCLGKLHRFLNHQKAWTCPSMGCASRSNCVFNRVCGVAERASLVVVGLIVAIFGVMFRILAAAVFVWKLFDHFFT